MKISAAQKKEMTELLQWYKTEMERLRAEQIKTQKRYDTLHSKKDQMALLKKILEL